jgi:hypothetical protein
MTNFCSTALKGMQDYKGKLVEFTQGNTNSALEFVKALPGVKSPSSTEHARQQLETISRADQAARGTHKHVTVGTAER